VKLTYDARASALYIRLAAGKVARTPQIDEGTLVDLDADGRLLGIEVLRPGSAWPLAEILRRWEVSDGDAAMLMVAYPNALPSVHVGMPAPALNRRRG
jgi:uncharacterized protein YuzE